MGENAFSTFNESTNNSSCFKEAVCIDAYRVYDSCAEKHYSRYIPSLIIL